MRVSWRKPPIDLEHAVGRVAATSGWALDLERHLRALPLLPEGWRTDDPSGSRQRLRPDVGDRPTDDRLLWRIVRTLLVLLVLVGGPLTSPVPFCSPPPDTTLITRDGLARSDMVLVLSGSRFCASGGGPDLSRGVGGRNLLTSEPRPPARELFRLGIRTPTVWRSLQLLEALRVRARRS